MTHHIECAAVLVPGGDSGQAGGAG
jgi:hypothetical protein